MAIIVDYCGVGGNFCGSLWHWWLLWVLEEQVWLVGKIKWPRTLFANQQLSFLHLENTQWRKFHKCKR